VVSLVWCAVVAQGKSLRFDKLSMRIFGDQLKGAL